MRAQWRTRTEAAIMHAARVRTLGSSSDITTAPRAAFPIVARETTAPRRMTGFLERRSSSIQAWMRASPALARASFARAESSSSSFFAAISSSALIAAARSATTFASRDKTAMRTLMSSSSFAFTRTFTVSGKRGAVAIACERSRLLPDSIVRSRIAMAEPRSSRSASVVGSGRRVTAAPAPTSTATPVNITTFTHRDYYEHDLVNLLHSGRKWMGEGFRNGGSKEIAFNGIPDLVANAPLRVTTSLVASSGAPSAFQLTLNGTVVGTEPMGALITQPFFPVATETTTTRTVALPGSPTDLRVGLTYNSSDPGANAYLDYIEINAERQLKLSGSQVTFRTQTNIRAQALNRYVLDNGAGALVWDVTNPRRPAARGLDLSLGPGHALGWDQKSFPFRQEFQAQGGIEPLLLPWTEEAVRYRWAGAGFGRY